MAGSPKALAVVGATEYVCCRRTIAVRNLVFDGANVIPVLMIAAGLVLVLAGFLAKRRRRRTDDSQEEEQLADNSRSRMAPLPRQLSREHSENQDNSRQDQPGSVANSDAARLKQARNGVGPAPGG
ncbi:hypothetical protein [Bradyrhizobium brasilense]|uniref:hypothetical protein n=1 Tax=Bradyrhizobium brasilense TaxID=1419277 RepID=UPI003D3213DB|nr:LPXTG cell wall anchor domain-containing protein [Bradyrhizobium brasilense]